MSRVKGSFEQALGAAEEGGKKAKSKNTKKSKPSQGADTRPGTSKAGASAIEGTEKKGGKKRVRKPKYFQDPTADDDPSGKIADKSAKRVYDRFLLFWVDCDVGKKNFSPVFEVSLFKTTHGYPGRHLQNID